VLPYYKSPPTTSLNESRKRSICNVCLGNSIEKEEQNRWIDRRAERILIRKTEFGLLSCQILRQRREKKNITFPSFFFRVIDTVIYNAPFPLFHPIVKQTNCNVPLSALLRFAVPVRPSWQNGCVNASLARSLWGRKRNKPGFPRVHNVAVLSLTMYKVSLEEKVQPGITSLRESPSPLGKGTISWVIISATARAAVGWAGSLASIVSFINRRYSDFKSPRAE
jgi:hypothetical protein